MPDTIPADSPTGPGESVVALDGQLALRHQVTAEINWNRFLRWGPPGLLALGTLMSLVTVELLETTGERVLAGALLALAVVLQVVWDRRWQRHRREAGAQGDREDGCPRGYSRPPGQPSVPHGSAAYYVVRSALAFVLTWLNPFWALFAVSGYFDATPLLARARAQKLGLLATAVTLAGSQSSGLPPRDLQHWVVFLGLFALNGLLVLVFWGIAMREGERDESRVAAIAELERANARLARALRENANLHAQLLLQAREAGVADERGRLAAEIHDTLAQGLTGIITQLQATADAPDPATAETHRLRALALARDSLGEARRSVHGLGPAALEHAELPCAVRELVDEWARGQAVPAEFTVTGEVEPLHEEVAATLLRIAQEALANIARHARARRVGVTLSYMDDEVTLDVRDDGCGFDPSRPHHASGESGESGVSDATPGRSVPDGDPSRSLPAAAQRPHTRSGFGLGGMAARAERVAGTFEIESEPGQGTALSVRVPLVRHV
ncbi:sensor histidine kinase [Streptomyces sp. XM4193]|uniref:sensor histidine kinase n=1 Tax=Streptomyces sp. XM4193 TaxID=2929782 RepID=UPI001FF7D8B4|nr:sensor histidine kinase [Streptomyces sp. XM4193]MCK1798418.1 sensor histidine kinase [Streptomyces sp. XM4193]